MRIIAANTANSPALFLFLFGALVGPISETAPFRAHRLGLLKFFVGFFLLPLDFILEYTGKTRSIDCQQQGFMLSQDCAILWPATSMLVSVWAVQLCSMVGTNYCSSVSSPPFNDEARFLTDLFRAYIMRIKNQCPTAVWLIPLSMPFSSLLALSLHELTVTQDSFRHTYTTRSVEG